MTFNPTNPTDSPDFIQVAPWGSGNLVNLNAGFIPAGITQWPVQYVGAAGALLVYLSTNAMAGIVSANFWGDQAMTKQLFGAIYNKGSNTGLTVDVLPIMGPWFNITTNNTGGQQPAASLITQLLPAYPPPGSIAKFLNGTIDPVLAGANLGVIAAGGFTGVKPAVHIPGPAKLYLWSNNTVAEGVVQLNGGVNNGTQLAGLTTTAGAIFSDTKSVTLPNDDIQIVLLNRGGAGAQIQYALISER